MLSSDILVLGDELLLGKGAHKACWIDPRDDKRCVKVAYAYPDLDIRREMKYRRCRKWRGVTSRLLPGFYGTVETDKGRGYVYERICNYDGSASLELGAWLQKERERRLQGAEPLDAEALLRAFRDAWVSEGIVMTNTQLENIMIQEQSAQWGDIRWRIVDNIGTHVTIPLLFFLDYLARKHVKRYWNRLLQENLHAAFPDLFDDEMIARLNV